MCALRIGQGVFEPRVLVGGVVDHQVEDDAHSAFVAGGDQAPKVVDGAHLVHDAPVVSDVVAHVLVGGREDGGEPQAVDAQVVQVGDLRQDAGQITDAVAVAVREGPRVDLVEHRPFPPRRGDGAIEAGR